MFGAQRRGTAIILWSDLREALIVNIDNDKYKILYTNKYNI